MSNINRPGEYKKKENGKNYFPKPQNTSTKIIKNYLSSFCVFIYCSFYRDIVATCENSVALF